MWNVNGLASFVLKNLRGHEAVYRASSSRVAADRQHMREQLKKVPGLTTFPSQANFLFLRECSNKVGSSDRYLRAAVLGEAASVRLARALTAVLAEMSP